MCGNERGSGNSQGCSGGGHSSEQVDGRPGSSSGARIVLLTSPSLPVPAHGGPSAGPSVFFKPGPSTGPTTVFSPGPSVGPSTVFSPGPSAGPSTPGVSAGSTTGTSIHHSLHEVVGNWKKEEPAFTLFPYMKVPGPTFTDVTPSCSAYDLFSRFFTEEVWELLVTETNCYAEETHSHTPHARPWVEVTVPELKAFLGLLIYMGILKLPRLDLYWSLLDDHIYTPGLSRVMSLVHFQQIFHFFFILLILPTNLLSLLANLGMTAYSKFILC